MPFRSAMRRPVAFWSILRLSGYRAALARHAVPEPHDLVVTGLTSPREINAAVTELMQRPEPPTAVLALNLGISSGVLLDRIVNRRDTAFVALDENELSAGLGISAITRDPFELGRQAAVLALERITDPTARPRTVTLPSVLVRRGSGELPPPSAVAADDGVPAVVAHEVVQPDGSGVARD
ncbi:substrate-binding domain-containing protein [Streptomyces sp. NPDC050416]|uniref:substrate-binding domain-containing protein n=1 Tax=Streptomyces sp. NPDC050416 TaxID=3365611 RepID=UPI0037B991CE